MPHINYHRGETRTFVVRKDNWNTGKKKGSGFGSHRWFQGSQRWSSGMFRYEAMNNSMGPTSPFCPCCTLFPHGSREGKQHTNRYARRVVDKEVISLDLNL